MVKVVAIEREYGSGASAIACGLAGRLGFTVFDQAITQKIAQRLHCSVQAVEQREERPDPTYYRLVKTFMRGSYEDQTGNKLELLDAEGLSRLFEKVCFEIADQGSCVLIGRAAPYFLRERDDVCRVFLYASHEEKRRRIRASGRTEDEAEDLLNRVDAERAAFVKRYYDMNWPTRTLYHLMINTGAGNDAVIEMILKQIEILNR